MNSKLIVQKIDNIDQMDLKIILMIAKILNSNCYSYSWKSGKYGVLSDNLNNISYKIERQTFERIKKIIETL